MDGSKDNIPAGFLLVQGFQHVTNLPKILKYPSPTQPGLWFLWTQNISVPMAFVVHFYMLLLSRAFCKKCHIANPASSIRISLLWNRFERRIFQVWIDMFCIFILFPYPPLITHIFFISSCYKLYKWYLNNQHLALLWFLVAYTSTSSKRFRKMLKKKNSNVKEEKSERKVHLKWTVLF